MDAAKIVRSNRQLEHAFVLFFFFFRFILLATGLCRLVSYVSFLDYPA